LCSNKKSTSNHHLTHFTYLKQAKAGILYTILPGKREFGTNKPINVELDEILAPHSFPFSSKNNLLCLYRLRKLDLLNNTLNQLISTH